jgi:hypothetical protein
VRDNDIEGKTREGKTRDDDARLTIEVPCSLARACFDAARRVDDHRGRCRARASLWYPE